MGFDIFDYIDSVESKLREMTSTKCLLFSAWCSEALVKEFSGYLKLKIDKDKNLLLHKALEKVWNAIIHGEVIDINIIKSAKKICESLEWNVDNLEKKESLMNYGATETIECLLRTFNFFINTSPRESAECAERVLNRYDFEISMILGKQDTFSHKLFQDELMRQRNMLNYLEIAESFEKKQKNIFRTG